MRERGAAVELVTDARALKYGGEIPVDAIHSIPAATTTGAGALNKARATAVLGLGLLAALALLPRLKPRAVVGFGGYPTVPPLLAAWLLGAPSVLHEQNAVVGRANRFLAPRVSRIATGFPEIKGARRGARRQDALHRQSGAPGGDRRRGDALSRLRRRPPSVSSSPAARRARG